MAINNNEFGPSCAAECADNTLETFAFICASPGNIELSEIQEIYIDELDSNGDAKNPISGWTNTGLAANAAINEAVILAWLSAADPATGVRIIEVIGDKPETTSQEVTLPKGKILEIDNRHSVNFDVLVMNNQLYYALRKLQGCKGNYAFWYRTSRYLYGGGNGIGAVIRAANFILDRGPGAVSRFQFTIEWPADAEPPRDLYPLANTGS